MDNYNNENINNTNNIQRNYNNFIEILWKQLY